MFLKTVIASDPYFLVPQTRGCIIVDPRFQESHKLLKPSLGNIIGGVSKDRFDLRVNRRVREGFLLAKGFLRTAPEFVETFHQVGDIVVHIHVSADGSRRMPFGELLFASGLDDDVLRVIPGLNCARTVHHHLRFALSLDQEGVK